MKQRLTGTELAEVMFRGGNNNSRKEGGHGACWNFKYWEVEALAYSLFEFSDPH
jgi:hypothetical protein